MATQNLPVYPREINLMTAEEWKAEDERHGCAVCRYRAQEHSPAEKIGCQVIYDTLSELNLTTMDQLQINLPSCGICDNYDCDEVAFQHLHRGVPLDGSHTDNGVRSGMDYPASLGGQS